MPVYLLTSTSRVQSPFIIFCGYSILIRKIALVFFTFGGLFAPFALRGDDQAASRLNWLLNPQEYISENQTLKSALEQCVAERGFVEFVRIVPASGSNFIQINITNVSNITITGLLVQPVDDRLAALDLDGRVLIEFDDIPPNGSAIYSEEVDGLLDEFPEETLIDLIAWDVVNSQGEQIVRHIFWSQWPTISSDEELAYAQQIFCGLDYAN